MVKSDPPAPVAKCFTDGSFPGCHGARLQSPPVCSPFLVRRGFIGRTLENMQLSITSPQYSKLANCSSAVPQMRPYRYQRPLCRSSSLQTSTQLPRNTLFARLHVVVQIMGPIPSNAIPDVSLVSSRGESHAPPDPRCMQLTCITMPPRGPAELINMSGTLILSSYDTSQALPVGQAKFKHLGLLTYACSSIRRSPCWSLSDWKRVLSSCQTNPQQNQRNTPLVL